MNKTQVVITLEDNGSMTVECLDKPEVYAWMERHGRTLSISLGVADIKEPRGVPSLAGEDNTDFPHVVAAG